jgi:dinuclear metal center YbgI/SA1388 family protein
MVQTAKGGIMTLQELVDYLGILLQPEMFTDYCPNGLQVEGKKEIGRVGTAVTASLETIEKAIKQGCDALVVHHGLFWKGDPYPVVGPKAQKLRRLMEAGCSLLAYHLPLDAHRTVGNNWCAAQALGWNNLQPFGQLNGIDIGVSGELAPLSVEEFRKALEKYYDHPSHCALGGKEVVSSAALISGGAYRSIPEAAEAGVDCFITGNFDEPAWHLAKELGVNFFALGHAATERVGPRALAGAIKDELAVETVYVSDENPF